MGALPYAVHRTVFVVDVEKFGDRSRTGPHQVAVRDGLYRALRRSFDRSGVSWEDCHREDRGDGVLILIPPQVPKDLLATLVPVHLAAALAEHNAACSQEARIRLRAALHAGEVRLDAYGATGTALILAFRLLESAALRSALTRSPGALALMASEWFFEEVIRHNPVTGPDVFRRVAVSAKETETTAWVCLPDEAGTGQSAPSLTKSWRDPATRGAGRLTLRHGMIVGVALMVAGLAGGILLNISRPSAGAASDQDTRISVAAAAAGCGLPAQDGFRSPATTGFKDIETIDTVSLDGRSASVMQGTYAGLAYDWLQSNPHGDRAGIQLRWFNTANRWHYCTATIAGGAVSLLPAQVVTMAVPVTIHGRQVTFQACIWHQLPFTSQCSTYL
jgi:hypothetical protein